MKGGEREKGSGNGGGGRKEGKSGREQRIECHAL
jgi:hypothetical protein